MRISCVRCLYLAVSLILSSGAAAVRAQTPAPVDEIIVRGRSDSLVGIAGTASEGTVGALQLERRPLSRPGEVLETVPGLIVTQHSGAGKANQFFLRGFNLDHGTDFLTSIDGVPVNLVSHGHGQGYSDLNFLIPELVERVNYDKGVYYAANGDFSSAGAARLEYFNALPDNLATLELGMFGYARGLLAGSAEVGGGSLLSAVELFHNDGPWDRGDGYGKLNAVLRYSRGDAEQGWSVTGSAYHGKWNSTDQIARRFEQRPGVERFDTLNDSDNGESSKYMLYGEWHRSDARSATRAVVYGFRQNLDLVSDFSYFLASDDGDQFLQLDQRYVSGGQLSHTWFGSLGGRATETTMGLQLRADRIENGLLQTVNGHRRDKVDRNGDPIFTRRDDIWETSAAPYVESKIEWSDRLRTVLGVRADFFHFDVDANNAGFSGARNDALVSPKASIIYTLRRGTELYVSGGYGFHSNDARGVNDPNAPADPLVRTYGVEVGVRTALVPNLQSTFALWWLDADSELLFVGDAGSTEASRPSRRYGIELANYYTPTEWLTLDFDLSLSRSRFRDGDRAGRAIPGSVEAVVASGISVHDVLGGLFAELRMRYFGPRDLIEDESAESRATMLMSARIGYEFENRWTVSAELFNLLNRRDSEIDYYYPSLLPSEQAAGIVGPDEGGFNDVHLHPADPISFRITLTRRF
jgi:hypothetical protein